MAEQEFAEVINLLEAEPSSGPAGSSIVPDFTSLTAPGHDIPALREQLAVLVSTGKAKEAISVQLTHEQLKRLTDKEVEKYYKRYETFVCSKTTKSMVDSLLTLLTRGLEMVVEIDDIDAMKKELKEDYIINKEMTDFVGSLALKYGKFLAPISVALITAKHIKIPEQYLQPAEQFQTNSELLHNNFICLTYTLRFKMSTEQSESAHSQGETQTAHSQVDITQQATTTTLTPTTTLQRMKNPKRVAAGKLLAERTRLACEQQKKAAAETAVIIANSKTKRQKPPLHP